MTLYERFIADGPRQPAPGIIWPVEEWVSFGAEVWDLDRRCAVCGGNLETFDHRRCWPSMEYAESFSFEDFCRQHNAFPRNPRNSTESTELTNADRAELVALVDLAARHGWNRQSSGRVPVSAFLADLIDRSAADSALIDAIAAAGIVIRPLVNFPDFFGAEGDRQSFPSWRAAALAALARAGVQIPAGV